MNNIPEINNKIEKEFKESGKYQTLPAVKEYAGSRIILLDYKEPVSFAINAILANIPYFTCLK